MYTDLSSDLSLEQWITQAAALIVPKTCGMPKKQQALTMARHLAAAHGPGGDLASMSPQEAVDFMVSHDELSNDQILPPATGGTNKVNDDEKR